MALQVWLPLNGNLDNRGLSDVTITNNGAVVDNNGKIGKCYYFNGSSYIRITVPTAITSIKNLTIAAWVKSTSTTLALGGLSHDAGNNTIGSCTLYSSGWQFSNNGSWGYVTGGSIANTSIWKHVCCTVDNTTITTYLNGIQVASAAIVDKSAMTNLNSSNFIEIGCDHPGGDEYLTGYVNDFRVYDHCLSPKEIKEISKGLVLHYPLDNIEINNTTLLTSEISNTAYNGSIGKYGYNDDSNLAKTTGTFQGKSCTKISTRTTGVSAQPYVYFSNIFTSNGTNQPAYKILTFEYYTTCPTTTWLNIYKLGSGTGIAMWKTMNSTGVHSGTYTNSSSAIQVKPNEWNYVEVILHGTTDANAEWGYCINGPSHTSNANYYFLYANIHLYADNTALIYDSSGYGHHGISKDCILQNDTSRYGRSILCQGTTVDNSSNTLTGAQYFYGQLPMPASSALTVAWWGKNTTYGRGGIFETTASVLTDNGSVGTDYNTTAIANWDNTFRIYNGSSAFNFYSNFIQDNKWHHRAIVFDAVKGYYYEDGVLKNSAALTGTLPAFNSFRMGLGRAGGVYRQIVQSVSDLRIYATALSAADILELYKTAAVVDNQQNLYAYEFVESTEAMINKTGVFNSTQLFEQRPFNTMYDKQIYTEPDGSSWLHIFHHNNPAAARFGSTNTFASGVYLDANRWYNVEQALGIAWQYEFMVKQKTTSDAAETKWRWIQNINPMTATWNDVKPGTITYITTSGYTNGGMGGMYYRNDTNQRMCIANSSNGNWFGGIGVWALYQGGIPGYPNTTVTTGYVDLYLRIYPQVQIHKDGQVKANCLYEF